MTVGAALLVIVAGLLIAGFLNATIGWIVTVVGVLGLVLAAISMRGSRPTV